MGRVLAKGRHKFTRTETFPMKPFSSLTRGLGRLKGTRLPKRAVPLAQRLGFAPDAKLLIVHADDLGLTQSVNASFIRGQQLGVINSGSAMVPCPAFDEIADFARQHPDADIGLHLTLTSQRADMRCASAAPAGLIPSLVDHQGYLREEWSKDRAVVPAEVEIEIRAQIEKARAAGFNPTHIDSHQFKLQMAGKGLFETYIRVSRDYDLPLLVSREWFVKFPDLQSLLEPRDIVLDRVKTISSRVRPGQWSAYYREVLEHLPSGVSEILIHPAYDDEDTRAFFGKREEWGAAWRQRDYDFFTGSAFRQIIAKQHIKLITWRDITLKLKQGRVG